MKIKFIQLLILFLFSIGNAIAEPVSDKDNAVEVQTLTLYDEQLAELYYTLGALHSLSNICFEKNQKWRDFAQSLNSSENLNSLRRAKLYASFNTAYRTFTTTYQSCTNTAKVTYAIYKKQGKQISNNLINKLAYTEK